ncbi:MAG TPA: heparan-alpha-glucosaminide N-acetyltransferase domain-containing protein [Terriglobales bacterium]|nr:heparan-alpha-glucosaminide N-acetyltransferase domain-containing protein [Terriglobales bacterium]
MDSRLDTAPVPSSAAVSAVATARLATRAERLVSVDLLRGVVMVLMALDHTRDYLTYARFAPEDVAHATLSLFFTRWITHFCAPVFCFLAGTGAFLSSQRKSREELVSFLWRRGLLLVLMEETVLTFCFTFFPLFPGFIANVIWMLGWSMVFLALLVRWLPVRAIGMIGLALIAGHNLFDPIRPAQLHGWQLPWRVSHEPGFHVFTTFHGIPIIGFVLYPLVPWIGVMAAGYAFAAILKKPAAERRRWMLALGIACVLLFIILRAGHLYGNPPASADRFGPPSNGDFHLQATPVQSVVAFLNVQKYPPSLQFLLMTLGPALLLLAYFDQFTAQSLRGRFEGVFLNYGRVPMFYFVVHILLIHVLAVLVALAYHQPAKWLLTGFFLNPVAGGYGHGLPFIYAMWFIVVAILYVPCKWFAELKATKKDRWLSYL